MSTAAQIAANRTNSKLSTGPTTATGQAASKLNGLKTGLTGRTVILPSDDLALYQSHIDRFQKKFEPATDEEQTLVQSLADTEWRLARIPSLETGVYALGRLEFARLFEDQPEDVRKSLVEAKIFVAYQRPVEQSRHPGKTPPPPARRRHRRAKGTPARAQERPPQAHHHGRLRTHQLHQPENQVRSRRIWLRIYNPASRAPSRRHQPRRIPPHQPDCRRALRQIKRPPSIQTRRPCDYFKARSIYSISRGRFLRLRLRARASFVRRFSPGFR